MIKFFISILIIASISLAQAQQLPQFTQYQFNEYAINPAFSGSKPYFDVRSNNRYQWVGITDAPRTYTISINGPSKNKKMGFGGYVFTDIVGPTRRIGAQASYSYQFKLTESDIKLSIGLSAGVLQWLVDGSKIRLYNPTDAIISDALQSSVVPDAKFGLYLYQKEQWYFGFSVPNLLGNRLYFFDYQNESLSRLKRHFLFNGGYKFDIDEDWQIEPSVMFKYVKPAPLKADINVRGIYKKQIWLGAAFRTQDAWSLLVGYLHKGSLQIGYSYDFTTTNLRNYSTGTHELMLGIRFVNEKELEPSPEANDLVE